VLEDVCYSYPCLSSISPPEDDPSREKAPYPYYFDPTFHRYRLDEPQKWKKPRTIFVCSMADLSGEWVPNEWKQDVIAACKAAPQHRYLFLTKNPHGYGIWPTIDRPVKDKFDQDNFWLGCTMTGREDLSRYEDHYGRYLYCMGGNMLPGRAHRFISIEPIMTDVMELPGYSTQCSALEDAMLDHAAGYSGSVEWIIVGAETGNRKGKVIPERKWIEKIIDGCVKYHIPLFMKESLREIMGEDFRQEFPWEVNDV
jgi:protein gp37